MNFQSIVAWWLLWKNTFIKRAKKANFGQNLASALQVHFETDFNVIYHSELGVLLKLSWTVESKNRTHLNVHVLVKFFLCEFKVHAKKIQLVGILNSKGLSDRPQINQKPDLRPRLILKQQQVGFGPFRGFRIYFVSTTCYPMASPKISLEFSKILSWQQTLEGFVKILRAEF